ncbi:MAG: PDZ domain-containing protein [Planctomycetes bacterium]|nr:PDZ domain-containing protein [Planctomycetota bacterium]
MMQFQTSPSRANALWIAIAGAGVLAAAAPAFLFAQNKSSQGSDTTKSAASAPAARPKISPDVAKLIQQLGNADFDDRDAAMDKFREMGDSSLAALDDAGNNNSDSEIRWNARRVAREIRRGETGKVKKLKDLNLNEMRAQRPESAPKNSQDRDNNNDQDHDDLQIELPGFDFNSAPDIAQLREQMRRQMEDVQRQMDQMRQSLGSATGKNRLKVGPGGTFQMSDRLQGSSVQIDGNGVKVTTKEKDANGDVKEKTYEAPTVEEFRTKYPDIAEKYIDSFGGFKLDGKNNSIFQFRTSPAPFDFKFAPTRPDLLQKNADETDASKPASIIGPENGERLGVAVKAIPDEVFKFLGLDSDAGFMVESVVAGGQAESLGLKANDVVLAINGKKIGAGMTTIREALAAVPPGAQLRVEVVRGMEGRKTLECEKTKERKRANR